MATTECVTFSEDDTEAGCGTVRKRKGKGIRLEAKESGKPHSTLSAGVKGRKPIRKQHGTIFQPSQKRIIDLLKESARQGFSQSIDQLINKIQTIVSDQKTATPFEINHQGKDYCQNCFTCDEEDEFSPSSPQPLGSQWTPATESKLIGWFKKAEEDIQSVDSDVLNHPQRIFNFNESVFLLGGDLSVTVLMCGNAAGSFHSPLLIFPGNRLPYDPLDDFPEAHFGCSTNGLMDSDLFESWFESGFCTAISNSERPVVLFGEGHKTHLTMKVNKLCETHGVILYQIPNHASHIVQPLDLTFKNLKKAWKEEIIDYQENISNTSNKRHFASVFKKAWIRGLDNDVLVSGFRAAGLYPWNPNKFDGMKLGLSRLMKEQTAQHRQMEQTEVAESNTGLQQMETDHTEKRQEETEVIDLTLTDENVMDESTLIISPSPSPLPPRNSLASLSITPEHGSSATLKIFDPQLSGITPNIHIPSPTATTNADRLSLIAILDRLLDLSANAGCQKLIHYRTLFDLQQKTDDPEQQHFLNLYGQLKTALSEKYAEMQESQVTIDSLPVPQQIDPENRIIIKSPKRTHSADVPRNTASEKKCEEIQEKSNLSRPKRSGRKKRIIIEPSETVTLTSKAITRKDKESVQKPKQNQETDLIYKYI